jgi:RNA polymerase sigma factor (sigma-70 family)
VTPEEVIASHRGLVRRLAQQYRTDRWPLEDLMQEANIALWKATVKKPGDDLKGVASYIIKRRILAVVVEDKSLAHRESGAAGHRREPEISAWMDADMSPGQQAMINHAMGSTVSAEDEVIEHEEGEWLRKLARTFPERQAEVILGKLAGESRTEIAARMGCTPQNVDKLFKGAARELRLILA